MSTILMRFCTFLWSLSNIISFVVCHPFLCVNQEDLCEFWANLGECKNNEGFMLNNCPLACGQCAESRIFFRLPSGDIQPVDLQVARRHSNTIIMTVNDFPQITNQLRLNGIHDAQLLPHLQTAKVTIPGLGADNVSPPPMPDGQTQSSQKPQQNTRNLKLRQPKSKVRKLVRAGQKTIIGGSQKSSASMQHQVIEQNGDQIERIEQPLTGDTTFFELPTEGATNKQKPIVPGNLQIGQPSSGFLPVQVGPLPQNVPVVGQNENAGSLESLTGESNFLPNNKQVFLQAKNVPVNFEPIVPNTSRRTNNFVEIGANPPLPQGFRPTHGSQNPQIPIAIAGAPVQIQHGPQLLPGNTANPIKVGPFGSVVVLDQSNQALVNEQLPPFPNRADLVPENVARNNKNQIGPANENSIAQPSVLEPFPPINPPQPLEPEARRPIGPLRSRGPLIKCGKILKSRGSIGAADLRNEGIFVTFEDVSIRPNKNVSQVRDAINQQGCAPPLSIPGKCESNACYTLMYRTFDGSCNNFLHPTWGASFTPILQNLPPKFDDNIKAPVSAITKHLPNPRNVSQMLIRSTQNIPNGSSNSLLMQWGQFMSHDIIKTALFPHGSCTTCNDNVDICMEIPVPKADFRSEAFGCENDTCCIKGPRTPPICGTGLQNPRKQMNVNTAFLDGSQIYGSSIEDSAKFRHFPSPFLKTEFFQNQPFLPFEREDCPSLDNCTANFRAGDDRVNVFVGLAAIHNIFVREHNRIASIFLNINPTWDHERIFQETRKIVGAEIQVITYKGWLPRILGLHQFGRQLGPYNGYKLDVNPTVSTEVSGAAFRFGHGMITEFYPKIDQNGAKVGEVRFAEGLLTSERLLSTGEMEQFLRGMILTPVKKPQRYADSTINNLFGNQDLGALNIQRAREMGLQGYNDWREFCGIKKAKTVKEFSDVLLDSEVVETLDRLYTSPDHVDLLVGALLEDPFSDGLVGPTLACLLGRQFKKLRDGDRFWYQNPGIFSSHQLAELEKASLSRIFCDNLESFGSAPIDAFAFQDIMSFLQCSNLPTINLNAWRTR